MYHPELGRLDPGHRVEASPTNQGEKHGFGLVVDCVAQSHTSRTDIAADYVGRSKSGSPGPILDGLTSPGRICCLNHVHRQPQPVRRSTDVPRIPF